MDSRRAPFRAALIFGAVGAAWILASSWGVSRVSQDTQTILRLETLKGWLFVALASVLVYVLVQRTRNLEIKARSELRDARALLEKTFASLQEGVFIVRDRRVVDCNPAAERMFGYTRDELVGSNTRMLHVSQDAYEDFGDRGLPTLEAGGSFTSEHELRRKNGETIITHQTMTLLDPEEGLKGGVVSVVRDITDRKIDELRLQRFYTHLQEAREEERRHIAREIHDDLGQSLTAMKMDLARIRRRSAELGAPVLTELDEVEELVDGAIRSVRQIATDLRPGVLDQLGLLPALEWLCDDFGERTGVECRFSNGFGELTLPPAAATHVFRVVQEALTNVARHAGASRVMVGLRNQGKGARLGIRDDGRGVDPGSPGQRRGLGVIGMRERARILDGRLEMDTAPGRGTEVILFFPLTEE